MFETPSERDNLSDNRVSIWRTGRGIYESAGVTMSEEIKTYRIAMQYRGASYGLKECEGGDIVMLSDHAAALAAKDKEIEELKRERDLAIAHDLQPYPTADAYEKVCAALNAAKVEVSDLRERCEKLEEATLGLIDLVEAWMSGPVMQNAGITWPDPAGHPPALIQARLVLAARTGRRRPQP